MKILKHGFTIIILIISILISFNKIYNFSFFNNLGNHLTNFINIFNNKEIQVACVNKYEKIEDILYKNDDYTIYSPSDGLVLKVDKNEMYIQFINGYWGYFKCDLDILVKPFDYVKKDDKLAMFSTFFTFYYYDDKGIYGYDEII